MSSGLSPSVLLHICFILRLHVETQWQMTSLSSPRFESNKSLSQEVSLPENPSKRLMGTHGLSSGHMPNNVKRNMMF